MKTKYFVVLLLIYKIEIISVQRDKVPHMRAFSTNYWRDESCKAISRETIAR